TILDADKEGFLRSERSLIQTMGRAARNENGQVIMYADKITDSMQYAIDETNRRREIQEAFNKKHGITPKTIKKDVRELIRATVAAEDEAAYENEQLAAISKLPKKKKKKKSINWKRKCVLLQKNWILNEQLKYGILFLN